MILDHISAMGSSSIRQRPTITTKQNDNNNPVHVLQDVNPRSSISTTIRQTHKQLHLGVWFRIIAIIGLFTVLSLFISRVERYEEANKSSGIRSTSSGIPPSFVTVVMPSVVKPEARSQRLINIAKTWGGPSNAVYVVHDSSEFQEKATDKAYPKNLVVPTDITIDMGVKRLEHVIRTIHKDYNPDFAFFVNDHTFVLPNNLCKFLKEQDSSKDLYVGHALKGQKETSFNSGAAGYVLSRPTMERLIKEFDNPKSTCSPEGASKWIQGNPGLLTAECFDKVLNIKLVDTRDEREDLSHKFHAYGLVRTVTGQIDDWYLNKHKTLDDLFGVDTKYHHLPQKGSICCSSSTISFHYVEAGESIVFWQVLQKVNQSPSMTDTEIQQLMESIWSKDKNSGLNAYSFPLPSSQAEVWPDMIKVVRKIASGTVSPSC